MKTPHPHKPSSRREAPGIIDPSCLYGLAEIQARSGLGAWGLRQARRAGLQVLRCHGRSYVMGQTFITYIQKAGAGEAKP